MKIAIVTDAWHPQVNGVVTTLSATIETLTKSGHTVLPITPAYFKTFSCPTYPEIRLSRFPGRKLGTILDTFAPDAVHIATEATLGWAARGYCRRNNMRFTTSYHTRFPEYVRLRWPIPLAFTYYFMKKFHIAATRTMVATADLHAELENRGFRNLVAWSRGVDAKIFHPGPKDFLWGRRPILMYVGRVAVEKNIEEFLRMDFLGTKYVVGGGPDLEEMKRKYPDVLFPGFKRGEELASYMAAADVFVFPSLTDTFGVVMLEANACGVPVAALPVIGPGNVVQHGETGWLSHNLREAVEHALLLKPEDCVAYARQFSWEKCTDQFLDNLAVPSRVEGMGQRLAAGLVIGINSAACQTR
ncbi:MAG: glycosyltransferase family 4 protein [Desulfobulbaceae bacterium]